MRLRFAMMAAVSLAMGCSSSSGGDGSTAASLDCAWLAGNNCWKSTLSEAQSCLPPKDETGNLSADLKSCTYASGAVVTFDPALVLPVPDEPIWSFTVTSGGQECLRLQDTTDSSFTLTVKGKTFSEGAVGLGLHVTCPDQTSYANSNAFDLLDCADGGLLFGGLPGKGWSESDSSPTVVFFLVGGANGSAPIFKCRKP